MAYKKLGPDVSESPSNVVAGAGHYTADEHSFESIVFQQDRPVLDWELNLLQEILGQSGSRLLALRTLPSCFLNGDFLEAPGLGTAYSFLPAVDGNENKFIMKAADLVVNGWPIRFEYSGSATPGENVIELPEPPESGNRTDLVILEVWRALVEPAPSVLNKSPTGQILRNGNAKAADQSPPGNVNLADDLLDPSYSQETQKRVQIQYRYRVIPGVTLGATDIDGFGTILARSVPYQAGSDVDGEAPISPLAYSPSPKSYGLWTAGDGDLASANALGTVDGHMYALPLCAVFRRNSSPFSEVNKNGGPLIASGSTNRPDGLYADQIVEGDVKDLRHTVAWDLREVLEKNVQFLLDNTLATEHEEFSDELSTVAGTTLLVGDKIAADAQHAGSADGCRLTFSDRSVTEAVVHKMDVSNSSSASFSLSSIRLPWSSGTVDVKGLSPDAYILHVTKVRLITATHDLDLLDTGGTPRVTSVTVGVDVGPMPDEVTLAFDSPATGTLFVEFLLTYPSNMGVQRNVLGGYELWTPDPSTMQDGTDSSKFTAVDGVPGRYKLDPGFWSLDPAHRELRLRIPIEAVTADYRVCSDGKIRIPERIDGTPTVAGQTVTDMTEGTAYTELTISPGDVEGALLSVTYTPYRAAEPHADGYRIWYSSRAIQSLAPPSGTQTLHLIPRCASDSMHIIMSGSGSPDDSFPYDAPGAQIPVATQPAADHPESVADAPNVVSIVGFSVNTGYARLPVLVPYSPNPSQVTLFRDALDGVVDGDRRRFWPKSDDGSAPVYSPTAFAANLSQPQRHKVAYPVICELKQDYAPYGLKGTMLLVVFTRWYDFSTENGIVLTSEPTDTGAAVFRLRGGPLNPRRSGS